MVVNFLSHFSPHSHYNVLLREKNCNEVWQIFFPSTQMMMHLQKHLLLYLIPSLDSFWCLSDNTWSGVWILIPEVWTTINTDKQLVQSLWTLNTKTHKLPPTTPLFTSSSTFMTYKMKGCTGEEDRQTS